MSRAFITGIEGFVGRHLARRLIADGHDVSGIHFADPGPGLEADLHRGDIRDFNRLKAILTLTRPDKVIHLAAVSSVAESETHVLETYDVNAIGTLNLLEALRATDSRARVLLISSADVYGRTAAREPLTEQTTPQPINPYALSKLAAEEAGRFSHRAFGTDVVILRPFSHTGPGQSKHFVFPTVARRIVEIERAAEKNPDLDAQARTIELGNLDVRRDYTDVRDVVRAYVLALDRCAAGETYNVTSGSASLIRDGVETLCRLARCELTYTSTAAKRRRRDLPLLTGATAKFFEATNWQPEIPFQQTLADLLDWSRTQRS